MKINYITITGIAIILGMSFVSCEKYLNVQSNSTFVVPKSLEDFQKLLNETSLMNFNTCAIGEASADDYFLPKNVLDILDDNARNLYSWQLEKYVYPNDWALAYQPVYTTNLIFDGLDDLDKTPQNETLWNQVDGAARYVRSTQYLNLVWAFGKAFDNRTASEDLGIVLRTTSDPNVPSTRATIRESYEFIVDELRIAADRLPVQISYATRPSKGAAFASLARAYLSMSQFDSAYFYVERALSFKSELLDFNASEGIDSTAAHPFARFNDETIYYSEITVSHPNIHPAFSLIDSTLYNSYADDDLRKKLYFNVGTDGYVSFKGSFTGAPEHFSGITTAELYLIKAECLARMDRFEEAVNTLNELLVRRWVSGTYIPYRVEEESVVLDFILQERRKELLMRGLRWIDIKRLNKLDPSIILTRKMGEHTYKLEPNDPRYALPLPDDIVQITGIPQNEW